MRTKGETASGGEEMKVKVKRKFLAWLGLVTLFFALPAMAAAKPKVWREE